MNMEQRHAVLCRARNLIDREGWCKGIPQGPDAAGRSGYCLLGAISQTLFGRIENVHGAGPPELDPFRRMFVSEFGRTGWYVNDVDCCTSADALAVLDRLIAATAPPPPDVVLAEPAEALV